MKRLPVRFDNLRVLALVIWCAAFCAADGSAIRAEEETAAEPPAGPLAFSASLRRDRTAERLLDRARRAAKRNDFSTAVVSLEEIFRRSTDELAEVDGVLVDPQSAALTILHNAPEPMLELYRRQFSPAATALLDSAADADDLLAVGRHFPATAAADSALRQWIRLQLDSANVERVAAGCEELLRRTVFDEAADRHLLTAAALFLDEFSTAEIREHAGLLPRIRRRLAGQSEVSEPRSSEEAAVTDRKDVAVVERLPADQTLWDYQIAVHPEVAAAIDEQLTGLHDSAVMAASSHRPILVGDVVITALLDRYIALDAATGALRWEHLMNDPTADFVRSIATANVPLSSGDHAEMLKRRILGDSAFCRVVPAGGLVLFAEPPILSRGRRNRTVRQWLTNRLVAVDAQSGNLAWQRSDNSTEQQHLLWLGPPTPWHGRLLGLIRRDRTLSLYCLDPTNGTTVWESPLCELPATEGDQAHAVMTAAPIVVDGNTAVCATNAGLVVGFDLLRRQRSWAVRYPRDDTPREGRGLLARDEQRHSGRWLAGGNETLLVVDEGRVRIKPAESQRLLTLDPSTGQRLQADELLTAYQRLCAAVNDRGIVESVLPFDSIAGPIGTGCTIDSAFVLPLTDGAFAAYRRGAEVARTWTHRAIAERTAAQSPRFSSGRSLLKTPFGFVEQDWRGIRLRPTLRKVKPSAAAPQSTAEWLTETGRFGDARDALRVRSHSTDSGRSSAFDLLLMERLKSRWEAEDTVAALQLASHPIDWLRILFAVSSGRRDSNASSQTRGDDLIEPSAIVALLESLVSDVANLPRVRIGSRLVRLDRAVAARLLQTVTRWSNRPQEVTAAPSALRGRDEAAASVVDRPADLPSATEWPRREPLVSSQRWPADDLYYVLVPVESRDGDVWDEVRVRVDRRGQVARFSGPGLERSVRLPRSDSPARWNNGLLRGWGLGRRFVLQVGLELVAIDPWAASAVVWSGDGVYELPRDQSSFWSDLSLDIEQGKAGFSTGQERMRDALGDVIGEVVHVGDDVIVVRRQKLLVVLDATTGAELWRRYGLGDDSRVSSKDGQLLIWDPQSQVVETLDQLDGSVVRSETATLHPDDCLRCNGRECLTLVKSQGENAAAAQTLRLQTLTGTTLWQRELSAGAKVFEVSDRLLGIAVQVADETQVTLIDGRTAASVSEFRVPFSQPLASAFATHDWRHAYIVLSTEVDSGALIRGQQIGIERRKPLVNGRLSAVDLATGALQWDRELIDRAFPLEQPRDVPFLVINDVRRYSREEAKQRGMSGNGQIDSGRITCIDKFTGKTLYDHEQTLHVYWELASYPDQSRVELRMKRNFVEFEYGNLRSAAAREFAEDPPAEPPIEVAP